MSRERVAMAVLLIGLLLAGLWWYFNAEFEDRLIVRPVSAQLNTERYFLAGRWLEQQGAVTRNQNRLDQLDDVGFGQRLLAHSPLDQYEDLALEALTRWVTAGGELIIMAPRQLGGSMDNHRLNPDGLTSQWQRSGWLDNCPAGRGELPESLAETVGPPPHNEIQDEEHSEDDCTPWENQPDALVLHDGNTIKLWNHRQLDGMPNALADSWRTAQGELLLARYAIGAGTITLLADSGWFTNAQLIHPGHVALLETLIPADPHSPVLLEQRRESGSLLGWLWRLAPGLWLLALAWTVLWIWSRLPRLGPVQDLPESHARQMREQLLATARFDWRHRKGQALVNALHEEGRQRLQRRYPDWNRLDTAQQLQRLGLLLPNLDRTELARWLTPPRHSDPDRFIDYVRLHQTVMHLL